MSVFLKHSPVDKTQSWWNYISILLLCFSIYLFWAMCIMFPANISSVEVMLHLCIAPQVVWSCPERMVGVQNKMQSFDWFTSCSCVVRALLLRSGKEAKLYIVKYCVLKSLLTVSVFNQGQQPMVLIKPRTLFLSLSLSLCLVSRYLFNIIIL